MNSCMKVFVSIFCLTLLLAHNAFANVDASQRLQKMLSNLSHMQATFYQRVIGSELSVIDEGAGRFYLSRPGKFRWDYFEEEGEALVDQIVSDGSDIYFYNLDLETVTVRSLEKAVLQVPSLVLVSDLVNLNEIFKVTELSESLGLNWFLLKPLSNEAGYDELRVGFSNGKLIAFSIADALGQTTQLQFDAIDSSSSIGKEVYAFVVPEGVDVTRDQ